MPKITTPPAPPLMDEMPLPALEKVASYFQALAEPTRLRLLNLLRGGERNVGELAQLCGYTAANVSRHLSQLQQQGLVERESRGTSAFYKIADAAVYDLCDLVCGQIARQSERQADVRAAFLAPSPPPAAASSRSKR